MNVRVFLRIFIIHQVCIYSHEISFPLGVLLAFQGDVIELLAEVALYLKWLIITVLKGLLYGPNCSYSLNIVLTDFEEIVFIYPVDFGEVSALG